MEGASGFVLLGSGLNGHGQSTGRAMGVVECAANRAWSQCPNQGEDQEGQPKANTATTSALIRVPVPEAK